MNDFHPAVSKSIVGDASRPSRAFQISAMSNDRWRPDGETATYVAMTQALWPSTMEAMSHAAVHDFRLCVITKSGPASPSVSSDSRRISAGCRGDRLRCQRRSTRRRSERKARRHAVLLGD